MPKKAGCCHCQPERKASVDVLGKFQDYFLRGTYVFCSCLIIYSLLMINGLAASDSNLKSENLLKAALGRKQTVTRLSLLPNPKEVWMETVFFMDRVGGNMGEPLKDTISLYSTVLAKTFALTGEALATIPQILTGSPPYAKAMGA
ncbi:MAG TPA: hypothetical protein VJK25_01980 [Patescibacteria group bacterium]|nr:hypothetical protein [Patescibacteria group bacterium]